MIFRVSEEVLKIGVRVLAVQIIGVENSKIDRGFEVYLQAELENIKRFWQGKNMKDEKLLQGFQELHTKVGRSNRKYPSSPEALLELFLKTGRFPRINTLVDVYNLVSLKSRLALGAHDIEKIRGNVTLRLTNGNEKFIPLGSKESIHVSAGEYAYIDDGNSILCRMEVLQIEPTKITIDTKNVFLIIQGNGNTGKGYIDSATEEVLSLIIKYCGGEYKYLNNL